MHSSASIRVALRIPGAWSHPRELVEHLPPACRLTPDTLFLPDGTEIEFGALPPDDQFAQIFRSSCRQPPTTEERAKVERYQVNVCLAGPGGSLNLARKMMEAAAAMVRAGGAGVFIDNSGLAHGGQRWLTMTDDGGPDALSFAFVSLIGGRDDIFTLGMHVLGLRDIVMKREDVDKGGFDIVDVIRYICASDRPVEAGHIVGDLDGPRFQAIAEESGAITAGSPMHNPFGRLRLVSFRDIAEKN